MSRNNQRKATPVAKQLNTNTYAVPLGPWNSGNGHIHGNARVVEGDVWEAHDEARYITLFHTYLLNNLSGTKFENMTLVDTGRTLTTIPGAKMFRVENEDENAGIGTYHFFCDWVGGGKNGHKLPITYETHKEINRIESKNQEDLVASARSLDRRGGKKQVKKRRNNKTIKKKRSKKSKTVRNIKK